MGAAAAMLVVVFAAATANEPITGAFGLQFDEPVTDAWLAASVAQPPYPLPAANLEQTLPAPLPGENRWFAFVPPVVPALLEQASFLVLRDQQERPVRILAAHPAPDCTADLLWLTRSLARKYDAPDDPFGAERSGFRHSARFVSARGQIDVSCGPALLIEYTDPEAYRRWLAAAAERERAHLAERDALEQQRELLTRERQRQLAETFTHGDRLSLEGALGIAFGTPVPPDWLIDGFVADEPLVVTVPDLRHPLHDGVITVTLGPDRVPVSVAGEFPDPDASRFATLSEALEAKFGLPLKHRPHHRIHKVSGDYLVARYDTQQLLARLVFIDDQAREAQQARELAARQARLEQQRQHFEEETAGL